MIYWIRIYFCLLMCPCRFQFQFKSLKEIYVRPIILDPILEALTSKMSSFIGGLKRKARAGGLGLNPRVLAHPTEPNELAMWVPSCLSVFQLTWLTNVFQPSLKGYHPPLAGPVFELHSPPGIRRKLRLSENDVFWILGGGGEILRTRGETFPVMGGGGYRTPRARGGGVTAQARGCKAARSDKFSIRHTR